MKRFILGFVLLSFISCSGEEDPIKIEPEELNLTFKRDGCLIYSFDYDQAGFVEVRNYHDELVVKISGKNNFSLKHIRLYLVETELDFPKNKKGLIPGRADYKKKFKEHVSETEVKFLLTDLPENFYIAAYAEFESPDASYEGWSGSIEEEEGDYNYFKYEVTKFPFYAGKDKTKEMTVSDVTVLPSWDEVRKVYAGMLDEGVDRTNGTYDPSISELIDRFNDEDSPSKLGDYTTTYSLGSGECSDSVELTLRVVAD